MKCDVVAMKPEPGEGWIMTVRYYPGWLGRLFGRKARDRQYIGDCTVWFTYPGFRRPCYFEALYDDLLYQLWTKGRHLSRKGLLPEEPPPIEEG